MQKKNLATIVTLFDVKNYGNRLQNYAVQCVVESLNCKTITIDYHCSLNMLEILKKKIKPIIKIILNRIYKIFNKSVPYTIEPLYKHTIKRNNSFINFNNKYLNIYAFEGLANIPKSKYYIIGSDQVWNPEWYGEFVDQEKLFLLTFCSPEQKICFAPSFGVDTIPSQWESYFKEKLSTFDMISVREKSGAELVNYLTGKKATVLIDPTLMLDKEKWITLSEKPENFFTNQPYILTYFLGDKNNQVLSDVDAYAKKYHYEIINLNDIESLEYYAYGPSEFLFMFNHASLVLTDSFHGSVFSFLFNKPFLVYDRQEKKDGFDMGSRIKTFLETFDLERKHASSKLHNDVTECDYSKSYKILQKERKKVYEFLKESMNLD